MSVALNGCETSSLILREVRRLRVIENRVLGRIFVPKRDEVTGEWRKLNNEEINDAYSSQNLIWVNISRRMRWVGNVAHMGTEMAYTGFGGKTGGKETTWKNQV